MLLGRIVRGNDLDVAYEDIFIIVLEGVLVTPKKVGKVRKKLAPVDEWDWYLTPLKRLSYLSYNNVSVQVATFISQEVADSCAEYFLKYGIPVSEVHYYDFDTFCQTLLLRRDLRAVYDSDPFRFNRYGQFGVATVLREDFQ